MGEGAVGGGIFVVGVGVELDVGVWDGELGEEDVGDEAAASVVTVEGEFGEGGHLGCEGDEDAGRGVGCLTDQTCHYIRSLCPYERCYTGRAPRRGIHP